MNPEDYEVIYAAGSVEGSSRKLVVVAAYMPPGDVIPRGKACLSHIGNIVLDAKSL